MDNLVDSHAHLDMLDDPARALRQAAAAGVNQVVAAGIDLATSGRAVEFAGQLSGVAAAVGIHPHDASTVDDESMEQLERLAHRAKVAAIGETGLDYYRDRSPRRHQQAAFSRQMELARRTGLPLIVHSRDAAGDTLDMLADEAGELTVVLHCFSLFSHVDRCAEAGYFMSMAGNITFSNAADLRQAAVRIPGELLLTETDSPFLTPVPHRGQANSPAYIPLIVERLAAVRDESPLDLAAQIHENFIKVFNRASDVNGSL